MALAEAPGIWVRVRSPSMQPAISQEEEVWVTGPQGPPHAGDVFLFEGPAGITVHRLLYRTRRRGTGWLRFRGDAAGSLDALVPEASVLGKAERVRGGAGERPVMRLGRLGIARILAASAARAVAAKFIPRHSMAATLGGFAFRVRAGAGIPRSALAPYFTFQPATQDVSTLEVILDSALTHADPLAVTFREGPPAVLGSSAFSLTFSVEEPGRFQLRVAPAVSSPGEPCPNALENGLRALLLWFCEREEGCHLVHAAAAAPAAGEGAWIVPAASGSGKTTMCRLLHAEGWLIAGDDLVVIRERKGELLVWGTAFSGDGADVPKSLGPYPLAGWILPAKGPRHLASPASQAGVAAALAAAAQRPPWAKNDGERARLERATRWAGQAPGWNLAFARAAGLGQYIETFRKRPGGEGWGK